MGFESRVHHRVPHHERHPRPVGRAPRPRAHADAPRPQQSGPPGAGTGLRRRRQASHQGGFLAQGRGQDRLLRRPLRRRGVRLHGHGRGPDGAQRFDIRPFDAAPAGRFARRRPVRPRDRRPGRIRAGARRMVGPFHPALLRVGARGHPNDLLRAGAGAFPRHGVPHGGNDVHVGDRGCAVGPVEHSHALPGLRRLPHFDVRGDEPTSL